MGFIAVAWFCSCGARFETRLRPGPVLDQARELWDQVHSGAEHEPRGKDAQVLDQALEDLRALIEAATTSEPPL